MMATPGIAASAYAQIARITDASAGFGGLNKAIGDAAGQGPSFGSLLKDALGAVSSTGAKSDAQTQAMVTGQKSNLVDVVTAVAETETAITTLVSVRDKVIASYQQIMQMPI
jgi:flagellar hook-basal body complex protein FliE